MLSTSISLPTDVWTFFGLGENDPSSKTLSHLSMSTLLNKVGLQSKLKPRTQPFILLNNLHTLWHGFHMYPVTLLENAWHCKSQGPFPHPELSPRCNPLLTYCHLQHYSSKSSTLKRPTNPVCGISEPITDALSNKLWKQNSWLQHSFTISNIQTQI